MKRIFASWLIFSLLACHHSPATEEAAPSPERAMQEALRQFPDSALLRENLIQFYRDSGYYDSAIHEAFRALERDSSHPRWWYITATLLCEKEDTAEAIRLLRQSPDIGMDRMNTILLATLFARKGDSLALPFSENLLTPLLDAAKEGYYISGLFYLKTEQWAKAISYFDSCLSESYTFMEAYREKATALGALNRWEEGAAVMKKAVTIQNNFAEGYYLLGLCLEKTGKQDEARDAYEKALLYDPAWAEAAAAVRRLDEQARQSEKKD